ncbi:uncharacterized protein SPPG_09378 [Spizellomyces punctatus DAOM BR117]|uniref:Uncharacterized protein n=1 Tax=Spizellomyces punctatus (strain DAOM BR117) TaxID=645134 RepID=A0A0L0HAL3_SPIPD|nr:uncharacterized protein SPPG_09378 [Spizellomyces punctatus DAOM BR117]KNC98041.1 hypothetical protein SPPG_09378 [Spizellomyces punctatus DAOM BR117]|eukprot:XP_016606081.1 hypothetical protein SPPG_09378 [Spizellomyces punctatus DAOM BR117]
MATWVKVWIHELYEDPNKPLEHYRGEDWVVDGASKPYATSQPLMMHIAEPYSRASDGGQAAVGIIANAKTIGKRLRDVPCAAWLDAGVPQHVAGNPKMARFTLWPDCEAHDFAEIAIEATRAVLLKLANAAETTEEQLHPKHREHSYYHFQAVNLKRAAEMFTALYVTQANGSKTPGTPAPEATDQIWFCANIMGRTTIIWTINEDSFEADDNYPVVSW